MKKILLFLLLFISVVSSLLGQNNANNCWKGVLNLHFKRSISTQLYIKIDGQSIPLVGGGSSDDIRDGYISIRIDQYLSTPKGSNSIKIYKFGGDPYSPLGYFSIDLRNSYTHNHFDPTGELADYIDNIDLYIFPTNISIEYPGAPMYLTDDGVDIKAFNLNCVFEREGDFEWVYSSDNGATWQLMPSKNASETTAINTYGVYGYNYPNIVYGGNTLIAIRYFIYENRTNPKTYGYTNILDLSNRKSTPHIQSVTASNKMCSNGSKGKLKVQLDRALLSGERLLVDYKNLTTSAIGNIADPTIGSDNSFYIENLDAGNYEVQVSGFYNGITTYNGGRDHKKQAEIESYPPLTYSTAAFSNINCYGAGNGSLTIAASGGAGTYKLYLKKDGGAYQMTPFSATGQTVLSNLLPGAYEYYVTDVAGCELRNIDSSITTRTVTLTQPPKALDFAFLPSVIPSGYGISNGSVAFEGDGGTPLAGNNYNVTWKNKTTNQPITTVVNDASGAKFKTTATNIPAGTYTVEIKDANDCTLTNEITIGEPTQLAATIETPLQILCNGDTNGELVAHARGGVLTTGQQYTYQWYKKNGASYQAISVTDSVASNLGKGDYKVEIRDRSRIVNITEKEFSLTEPTALATTQTKQDVTCYGGNNGSIQINVSGGVGGYKLYYKKADDAAYGLPLSPQGTVFTINNLTANQYHVYITDGNNCIAPISGADVATITINQPVQALEISNTSIKPVSGFGRSDGTVTIKIKGGTPNTSAPLYNVTWKNALGTAVASTQSVDGSGIFTSTIQNLPEGLYTVEVKDKNYAGTANSCYTTSTVNVTQPAQLTLQLENTSGVLCHGETTGILKAHARGGVPSSATGLPYTYKWYQVTNGVASLIASQTDSILSNRPAGSYKVRIEDASNPVNSIESAVFTITQPTLLVTTLSTRNIACFGENNGYIHIGVSGGVGGYKLFCKKEGTDADYRQYAINSGDNTLYLDNLYYGKYSVYILDANNCYAKINGQDIHEIILTQPAAPLTIEEISRIDVSGYGRSDGKIEIKIAGGTRNASVPFYNVVWRNAAGTIITSNDVVDTNNVFTSKVENIPNEVYTVEVKDKNYVATANTCYATASFTIVQPEPLAVQLDNTRGISCHGEETGKLVAHAKGGTPNLQTINPYTYKWYSIVNGMAILIPNQTDSILINRPAGFYKVRIEDFSRITNAVESGVFEITQPTLLTTSLATRNISCHRLNDGFIQIEVSGGVGGYKLFCKKDGEADYRQYAINADNTTFKVDNLYSGKYHVYVLDSNNCYAKINGVNIGEIILTQPSAPLAIVSMTKTDASGYSRSDGNIKITIEGGTAYSDSTYNIVWKNQLGQTLPMTVYLENGKFTSLLNNIPKGSYTVEVNDANYAGAYAHANSSCIARQVYSISEPKQLVSNIEETHFISCNGMSDGQLISHTLGGVVNPVAGRQPYKYKWYKESNSVFTLLATEKDSILSSIAIGKYKVEVEDYSRVFNTVSVIYNLVQPNLLQATASNVNITCGQTATISVAVTGGTAPYTYQWSTGDKTSAISNISPGRYLVFVTDSRGCETTAIAKVSTPSSLKVSGTVNQPVCNGSASGSIVLQVSGGTAPYNYEWNTGATTKDLTGLKAGLYTAIVTDRDGCSYTDNFILTDPTPLTVSLGEDRTLCSKQDVTLTPVVADAKTKFSWTGPDSFKAATPSVTINKEGTYSLTITDSKGCQATDDIKISVKEVDISSEIFVSTETFVGDTIVIANISNPEPENHKWLIEDSDSVRVVEMDNYYAKIVFTYPGSYKVGFRAYVGDCFQDTYRTVHAINKDETPDIPFGETIINEFLVYPNPNDGNFRVKIDLNKISSIRLRIVNVGTGYTVSDLKFSGQDKYDIPYGLTISSGAYVVILETTSGNRNIKMVTQ